MIAFRFFSTVAALAALAAAQAVPDFIPAASYAAGGVPGPAVVGDFNGDSLPDIASTDSSVLGFQICYGAPGGVFSSPVPRSVGFQVGAAIAVDVNNDSISDLVFTAGGFNIALVRYGQGGGQTVTTLINAGHATPSHIASGDFNKDGLQDLIVAGNAGFSYLRNLGNGQWAAPVLLAQPLAGSYVMTGDFNNDGNLDFVGTSGTTTYSYAGNGAGSFALPVASAAVNYGASLADFNNDGKLDIVHMTVQPRQDGSNQAVAIAVGQGNGQFITQYSYVLNTPIGQPVAGDFTGDGKVDAAVFIYTTNAIRVFPGGGSFGLIFGTPYTIDAGLVAPGALLSGDVDGNGSKDLVLTQAGTHRVYRNTHGNPPLLAQIKATPASVIGGSAAVSGTVTLGGPSAAGASVALTSSDPSVVFFPAGNTVNIAPGAASATFAITTTRVPSATSVTITATSNGVAAATNLELVASYSLSGFTANPTSQYGIFSVPGTITLTGAADSAAAVRLISSNPAVATVPSSVNVPSGATSVTFPIALTPVAVDTPVTISASLGGITRTATITVLRPIDSISINKAILTQRNAQLKIEATGSNPAATITVHVPATGLLLGTLTNRGGGKYDGTVTGFSNMTSVTLKSSLGGSVTGSVQVK